MNSNSPRQVYFIFPDFPSLMILNDAHPDTSDTLGPPRSRNTHIQPPGRLQTREIRTSSLPGSLQTREIRTSGLPGSLQTREMSISSFTMASILEKYAHPVSRGLPDSRNKYIQLPRSLQTRAIRTTSLWSLIPGRAAAEWGAALRDPPRPSWPARRVRQPI